MSRYPKGSQQTDDFAEWLHLQRRRIRQRLWSREQAKAAARHRQHEHGPIVVTTHGRPQPLRDAHLLAHLGE